MWAQARYDLGLRSREFWALTPRLFHLLYDRHREYLGHIEMLHAFTTAAVINSAPFRDEGVAWTAFVPNHSLFEGRTDSEVDDSEEASDARQDWVAKVQQLAAEMKAGGGVLMERVKRGESI